MKSERLKPEERHIETFTAKAEAVSTVVSTAASLADAAEYALRLCSEKVFYERTQPDGILPPREGAKIMAAPEMPPAVFASLAATAEQHGVLLVDGALRQHMDGIDVGFTLAQMGIAETGTCILCCEKEDTRLASMIAEVHVIALPMSKIVATAYDAEDFLRQSMTGPMYTAFISGCSRTSDIERVLALGVHGPLELHVVLMEEA